MENLLIMAAAVVALVLGGWGIGGFSNRITLGRADAETNARRLP
jgi:hypothetical protein